MKILKVEFYHLRDRLARPGDPVGVAEDRYLDMLRYDLAFVKEESPGRALIVAFPVLGLPKRGRVGGTPTVERWCSFQFELVPIDSARVADFQEDFTRGREWVTAMHPRDPDGRVDYGDVVKVPLNRVLAANCIETARPLVERG